MADRTEILNDDEEAMRQVLEGWQVNVWTCLPGIITKVNFSEMTCEVQPALQQILVDQNNNQTPVTLPLLLDCPIVFQGGGNFIQTFPIQVGDEALIHISSRCIDAWWQSGGIQQAMEARMHDLSDGFVVVGPRSLPNVVSGISGTAAQFRNLAGDVLISLNGDGKITIANATQNLGTVLNSIVTNLETLTSALAALTVTGVTTGGGVSGVPANAAAITAVGTALAANAVQLGALLE